MPKNWLHRLLWMISLICTVWKNYWALLFSLCSFCKLFPTFFVFAVVLFHWVFSPLFMTSPSLTLILQIFLHSLLITFKACIILLAVELIYFFLVMSIFNSTMEPLQHFFFFTFALFQFNNYFPLYDFCYMTYNNGVRCTYMHNILVILKKTNVFLFLFT